MANRQKIIKLSDIEIVNWDIKKIKNKFNCDIFFETGLYDPRSEVSSVKALKLNFKKVYTIEILDKWVKLGKEIFNKEIENNKFEIIHDDSVNIEKYIINNSDLNLRTLFFLDAHVDNFEIQNYKKKCPLFEELDAISKLSKKDHIICIDDVRILKGDCWKDNELLNKRDVIEDLKIKILTINKNYKFKFLNSSFKNDVLMAYID